MPSRRYIETYTHGGKIGVIIELACETSVPLKNSDFVALAHDLAMQIAAQDPPDIASLIQQNFIKNPARSVSDLLKHAESYFSERILVTRFVRWSIDDPDPADDDEPPPRRPAAMMRVVE